MLRPAPRLLQSLTEMIDIGANLTHASFEADYDQVVAAALSVGLSHIILTGTDLESSRAAQALASRQPSVLSSTAGFHPHVARDVDAQAMAALGEVAQLEHVVAVGETGLDFNRNFSPEAEQLAVFEQQLQLATDLTKPLFLHQRDAHRKFLPLLERFRAGVPGGVVHCFTDTQEALQAYLALDMYIGITGWICDERRGRELQGLVRHIPLDRLLVESDAPYLLPRTLNPKPKSRRNEPKYLTEVVRVLAANSDYTAEEIAAATARNARLLFGIAV